MAARKVVAVTGASRGIGAAIAAELARRGLVVGCLSRQGGMPEGVTAEPGDGFYVCIRCDVTDEASLKAAFAELAERAGGIHGLVNNAGIHRDAPSHSMPLSLYEDVMRTNATAVVAACREAYPHLLKANGALIVNIGSFFDKLGVKRNLAYCASKAAVGAITRCLAVEWASKRIRAVSIAPGYIETDMNRELLNEGALREFLEKRIPGGRHGQTSDVARLVGALFSEDIPFLNGETIYLDGGQAVAL